MRNHEAGSTQMMGSYGMMDQRQGVGMNGHSPIVGVMMPGRCQILDRLYVDET